MKSSPSESVEREDFLPAVPGQRLAKGFFQRALSADRLGHAYVFVGPRGSGKRLFARELARTLLCPQGGRDCRCGSCAAVEHGNHPGVTAYGLSEGKSVVDVKTIRALCEQTHYRRDHLQFSILEEADRLSEAAANALLKTLEEPPGSVVILLLAKSTAVLLPTIVSRCQRVPFLLDQPEGCVLSTERLAALADVTRPAFFADTGPREWLKELEAEGGSVKASLASALEGFILWGRANLYVDGTVTSGGADPRENWDLALRLLDETLELRADLDRNVQADLVLEEFVRRLRQGKREENPLVLHLASFAGS